jgi:hypothetical protein
MIMAKRGAARAVRLNCPKCFSAFTVVAYLSQGIAANDYWKARAEEHDCASHEKMVASSRLGESSKNPLKASKAAARGK